MKIIDPHVHVAPDVADRCIDSITLAKRGLQAGYKGIVYKSPASETATMAALTESVVPEVHGWGAITLNDTVGGLNPTAVESMFTVRGTTGRHTGRVVWMPTRCAINHIEVLGGDPARAVHLWEDGVGSRARPELYEVMEIIAAHNGSLATGHLAPAELPDLVAIAQDRGVERIIVTHVDSTSTSVPLDMQVELAARGCYMEHSYAGLVVGRENMKGLWFAKSKTVSFDQMLASIRRIGPEKTILSTDQGHVELGDPIEGMTDFIQRCRDAQIADEDIERMVYTNSYELFEG